MQMGHVVVNVPSLARGYCTGGVSTRVSPHGERIALTTPACRVQNLAKLPCGGGDLPR